MLLLSIFIGFLQENQILHVFYFVLRQRRYKRRDRKSLMSGDVHVLFRERLEGKFLGATRLILERV